MYTEHKEFWSICSLLSQKPSYIPQNISFLSTILVQIIFSSDKYLTVYAALRWVPKCMLFFIQTNHMVFFQF
jgi:hypothetical protein